MNQEHTDRSNIDLTPTIVAKLFGKAPLVWLIERRHFVPDPEPGKPPREEWRSCGRIRANSRDEAAEKAWKAVGDPNPNNVRVTGIAVHGQEIEAEAK